MKTKGILFAAVMMLLPVTMTAQRIQQPLGRGVVAVNNNGDVTVTWRRLAQEPEQATYNVYVNGVKKNKHGAYLLEDDIGPGGGGSQGSCDDGSSRRHGVGNECALRGEKLRHA